MPHVARWTLLSRNQLLARSSHSLGVLPSGRVLIYGGELKPRTPVDADLKGALHAFQLETFSTNGKFAPAPSNSTKNTNTTSSSSAAPIISEAGSWDILTAPPALSSVDVPAPRVGATSTIINDELYVWGGRGGKEMSPLLGDQTGVWRLRIGSDNEALWERLVGSKGDDEPVARSYHTMTSSEGVLYLHAGCPEKGRVGFLHSFDIATRTWKQPGAVPAPDPGRGGAVLISVNLFGKDSLLRVGGFAGYELSCDTVDAYGIHDHLWSTITPTPDPVHGVPGARSVHGFVSLQSPPSSIDKSKSPLRPIAVLFYGERDPSSLGHEGAGQFWNDVWLLVENDATVGLEWVKVGNDGKAAPEARGWFPSTSFVGKDGRVKVLLHGGLLESNERSGELWMLEVEDA